MRRRSSASRSGNRMRIRIWPILCLGFGALIALVVMSGWLAFVRSRRTYAGITRFYADEYQFQSSLGNVRSSISDSAILIRDFQLDPAFRAERAATELRKIREFTQGQLLKLNRLIPPGEAGKLRNVEHQLNLYWSSLDPLLTGSAKMRSQLGYSFIRTEILPRRRAALRVITDIEQLSRDAFEQRKRDIDAGNLRLRYYLVRSVGTTLLIALSVAAISIYRTYILERTAEMQHGKVLAAEEELRRLSQQLVGAQEEERRALSRDLHDQVGQVLTALRMSLGNFERAVDGIDPRITRELDLAKRLAGQALRSTRDLAMGLRPTMLDDLGLQAALEWYARQHAKLYGVPVSVHISAGLDQLSDAQKTCIYRIVQESLNNVAKHARASSIEIAVASSLGTITLEISDDGLGFDMQKQEGGSGLGLLGMRERVTQLGGDIVIKSTPNAGTRVSARLPEGPVHA
jgi:signal transduction histidine kinase